MGYQKKKVIACLITRMKSTRLKEKALIDLNGYTMSEQIIRRLKLSKYIDEIVLATSTHPQDEILMQKAKNWGIKAYAGHERDVLDRLMNIAEIHNGDLIIRVTGDNPFTDHEYIDRMIEEHVNHDCEYTRTNHLPLGVTAEIHSKEMFPKLRELIPDPNHSGYLSFFSFNPSKFNCLVLSPSPEHDRPYYSLTVDYDTDIELAREIYKNVPSDNGIPLLRDIIQYLDESPSYQAVSKDTEIKLPGDETMTYEELIELLDNKALEAKRIQV